MPRMHCILMCRTTGKLEYVICCTYLNREERNISVGMIPTYVRALLQIRNNSGFKVKRLKSLANLIHARPGNAYVRVESYTFIGKMTGILFQKDSIFTSFESRMSIYAQHYVLERQRLKYVPVFFGENYRFDFFFLATKCGPSPSRGSYRERGSGRRKGESRILTGSC